jgi:hypothetical protein
MIRTGTVATRKEEEGLHDSGIVVQTTSCTIELMGTVEHS